MISGRASVILLRLETSELCKLVRSCPRCCSMTWEEVRVCLILFQVRGVKHNHGFNMSIVSWRCVFYTVVFSFVVIFLDIRTGMCNITIRFLRATQPKISQTSYMCCFFLWYPRCNTGRFLYGLPEPALQPGAGGVSRCGSCIWCKGISWKPCSYLSTETEHPFPERSQALCTGDRPAGFCKPSELLSSQR